MAVTFKTAQIALEKKYGADEKKKKKAETVKAGDKTVSTDPETASSAAVGSWKDMLKPAAILVAIGGAGWMLSRYIGNGRKPSYSSYGSGAITADPGITY